MVRVVLLYSPWFVLFNLIPAGSCGILDLDSQWFVWYTLIRFSMVRVENVNSTFIFLFVNYFPVVRMEYLNSTFIYLFVNHFPLGSCGIFELFQSHVQSICFKFEDFNSGA